MRSALTEGHVGQVRSDKIGGCKRELCIFVRIEKHRVYERVAELTRYNWRSWRGCRVGEETRNERRRACKLVVDNSFGSLEPIEVKVSRGNADDVNFPKSIPELFMAMETTMYPEYTVLTEGIVKSKITALGAVK